MKTDFNPSKLPYKQKDRLVHMFVMTQYGVLNLKKHEMEHKHHNNRDHNLQKKIHSSLGRSHRVILFLRKEGIVKKLPVTDKRER